MASEPLFTRIVVGTDGYGPASAALARAAELAQRSGAELVVVHAYPPAHGAPSPLREPARSPLDVGRGLLQDAERRYGEGVRLRTELREGDPSEVLLDVADEQGADVIVVGNKGMSKRVHLGIVPDRVSHHASCHVLIVRTTE